MDTEIWAARLDRELTAREQEALRFFLPPVRRERFLQMKALSGRREILCAYGLLRLLLYEKFGWRTLPRIAFLEYGKPWFPDYPRVQFNLSHTAGAVMVGLSEQPVGVDIEKIRPVSSRMMQRTFVPPLGPAGSGGQTERAGAGVPENGGKRGRPLPYMEPVPRLCLRCGRESRLSGADGTYLHHRRAGSRVKGRFGNNKGIHIGRLCL